MSLLIYFILFFVIIVCIYWFYTNVLLKLRSLEKYIENLNSKEEPMEEIQNDNISKSDTDEPQNLQGSLFDSHNSDIESKDSLDISTDIDVSSASGSIQDW